MAGESCVRLTSAAEVFDRFGGLLEAAPIMGNLVASSLLHGDECEVFVAVDGGEPLGMGMRWGSDMTLTPLADPAAATLGAVLATEHVESITGPAADAFAVAGVWADAVSGSYRPAEVMRVLGLRSTPAAPLEGCVVRPTLDDLEQQVEWSLRFSDDVGHPADPEAVHAATIRQIERGRMFAWRADDRIVSRLLVSQAAYGVVRIGGVYTPDAERGRGHAAALTAAVSAQLLTRDDVTDVTLQAQSHEPHTNRMYRRLGFQHVGDLAVAELIDPR